jgi:hypothetical protein
MRNGNDSPRAAPLSPTSQATTYRFGAASAAAARTAMVRSIGSGAMREPEERLLAVLEGEGGGTTLSTGREG